MKILKIALINAFLFSTFFTQAQDPKAATILDGVSKKYKALNSFNVGFTYGAAGESQKGDLTTKGGKYYLKLAGQEVYNDGKTVATYVKEANEVNLSTNDPASNEFSPATIYNIYKNGYQYKLVEERKDGNAVIDLTPTNKSAHIAKVRMTIHKNDSSIKGWQLTDKSGKVQTFKITKFTPNVAVNDQTFSFNKSKYPGVEVIDLRD